MGKSNFAAGIKAFASSSADNCDAALVRMGLEIFRISQMQVPYRTGALQKSHAKPPVKQVGHLHYELRYDIVYARRRHFEKANIRGGRKTHYLSDPVEFVDKKKGQIIKHTLHL